MKKGFTLIELLIVVAIIAILAAIAVPNFMEAQTRAKVSRVASDFRSLTTALESYYVDYSTYVYGQGGDKNSGGRYRQGWRLLTSPVAYISVIPPDPFGTTKIKGSWRPPLYELGVGRTGMNGSKAGWGCPRNMDDFAKFLSSRGVANTYQMESDGPDNDDATGDGNAPSTSSYPGWDMNNVEVLIDMIYDSTNGTKSRGEIFRTGGVVPPGKALKAFCSHTNG